MGAVPQLDVQTNANAVFRWSAGRILFPETSLRLPGPSPQINRHEKSASDTRSRTILRRATVHTWVFNTLRAGPGSALSEVVYDHLVKMRRTFACDVPEVGRSRDI